MKLSLKKHPLIPAAGLCLALSMPVAQACDGDSPLIASVCIMATPYSFGDIEGGLTVADGRLLQVSQNQALYSLIGTTYGGSAPANFNLPDLRGRVVVGSGTTNTVPAQTFSSGQKGGAYTVMLSATDAPLPPHAHLATGLVATAAVGSLVANTTLLDLKATTTIANVTANTTLSNLTLKAYSGNGGSSSASGAALATAFGPPNKIYASSAPDVSMATGSVTGTATTTLSGEPTTLISGNPTTALSGAPTVAISGNTSVAGAAPTTAVKIMPPYLAMTYYIATQGLYPIRN